MVEEGEFKKRITEFRETFPEHGIIRPLVDWELLNNWIDEAKKEFEQILASDMPYFQKLLCLSKFKNDWFGDRE